MGSGNIQPSASSTDYPEHYKFAWAAALHDVEPLASGNTFANFQTAQGAMVLTDHITAASAAVGGNPYTGVVAYNPDAPLNLVRVQQNELEALVDGLADSNLTAIMLAAATEYDLHASTVSIEDAIDATEAASLASHLENVGRVNASLWAARAMMGSQAFLTVAAMEHDRARRLNEDEKKLRLFGERERTEGILRIAEALLRQRAQQVDAKRVVTGMQFDIAKLDVAMHQDQIEHDTEMAIREQTWDLNLFEYQWQGLAALGGASPIPKAQTVRERLAAAVMGSTSMALQGGVATGSPAIGLGIFGISLAATLFGMG